MITMSIPVLCGKLESECEIEIRSEETISRF